MIRHYYFMMVAGDSNVEKAKFTKTSKKIKSQRSYSI